MGVLNIGDFRGYTLGYAELTSFDLENAAGSNKYR